ncbi:MAG: mercuric reductase [Candidatus Binatia bacterium]|nr:mercuric reductase [Candidatus Binatia bacterium]
MQGTSKGKTDRLGAALLPEDSHDIRLLSHVRPGDWQNPEPQGRYNLVVIGGGTAGLVTAAGAAGLGARVALIEGGLLGGDCLNAGCVPSKAILRSAKARVDPATNAELGYPAEGGPDFGRAFERMRQLRADLSPVDSARRFRDELGVDVYQGRGRFESPDSVRVGDQSLLFHRAVIATGASPSIPPIPGLAESTPHTNESIFTLTEAPGHLIIIGTGPIGCELAQAFRRLGSDVTMVAPDEHILPREDRDASLPVQRALESDGVQLLLRHSIEKVQRVGDETLLHVKTDEEGRELRCDQLLVATGRSPNIEGLGLAEVGVETDPQQGIKVDDRLQTTNPRIYAAGDVCLEQKFTHAADFAARTVIQNALFRGSRKLSSLLIPRCTYTDPEIASVGLSLNQAAEEKIEVREWTVPFADLDRARLEGDTDGFVRILTGMKSDKILGATIVARHAGDLIGEVATAMSAGVGLGKLANVIHPYPTQADAIRKAGDLYNRTRLTPLVKRLFALWFRWNR